MAAMAMAVSVINSNFRVCRFISLIKYILHSNLHSPAVGVVAYDVEGVVDELCHSLAVLVVGEFVNRLVVCVHPVFCVHHKRLHGSADGRLGASPLAVEQVAEVQYVEVQLEAVHLLAYLHLYFLCESKVEAVVPWVEAAEGLCILTLVLAQARVLVDEVPEGGLLVFHGEGGLVGCVFHKVHLFL